jgi:transcriptional regulator with XRE-family HTH domain
MNLEPESLAPESWSAGQRLREVRQKLGLTLQRVEELSEAISKALNNPEFAIPYSRLSQIETRGLVPSVYRIHSLARIYRLDVATILDWYGIRQSALEAVALDPPSKSVFSFFRKPETVKVPVALDPSFDLNRTQYLRRVVEAWGSIPFVALERLQESEFLYGYVGAEDFTMYPILPPGSFVQVDGSKRTVKRTGWRGEYDRPIYAVDTREGLRFSWCSVVDRKMVLQPHPLSSVEVQVIPIDQVDVLGQVVGAAIRVGALTSV